MVTDRVVVTGIGVVSPYGVGVDKFWDAICSSRNAINKITSFDSDGYSRDFGGEVVGFDSGRFIKRYVSDSLPRTSQFAVAVARMASEDAGIQHLFDKIKVGVSFGTTMGNQSCIEERNDSNARNPGVDHLLGGGFNPVNISRSVCHELKISGPIMVQPTACAAGSYAIGWGYDLIVSGGVDVVLAGGADAMSRGCYAIFNRLRAMAKKDCKPFDKNRTGMIVSEGAACLVLERESHARKRGAKIIAELVGYGMSCDAHHPTAPEPNGDGVFRAMRNALDNSKRLISDVSYISAHGTGTPANDKTESKGIKSLFDEHAAEIPVSSIKSMIGHTMGGASAIESAACVLAIRDSILPPNANLNEIDPECHPNIVQNTLHDYEHNTILNNGIGFGGNIATTVFGVYKR